MSSIEDYDLKNVFELVGIDSLNIDDLKRKVTGLCSRLRMKFITDISDRIVECKIEIERLTAKKDNIILTETNSTKAQESIDKCDNRIKYLTDKVSNLENQKRLMHEKMDKYVNSLNSANDESQIIFHIISLKMTEIYSSKKSNKELDDTEKEYRKLVKILFKTFKTPNDVDRYINDNLLVKDYINYQSALKLKPTPKNRISDLKYGVKTESEPKEIMNVILENGDRLQVYNIGKFAFRHINFESESYSIVTALRRKENGEVSINNGIIQFREPIANDLGFYANVVFSDFSMRFANQNTGGYLGEVVVDDKGRRSLTYDGLFNDTLVKALYFAKDNKGVTNLKFCDNLTSVYMYMDDKVKQVNNIRIEDKEEKQNKSDEGGR